MRVLNLFSGVTALAFTASAQSTNFCDPLTSICYQSYTTPEGISFRVALPQVTAAPFDLIIQIVAPIAEKWVGLCFGGRMTFNPLAVAWPNGASALGSPRMATGYAVPLSYAGATFTPLRGTGANSTSWTWTARCQGCSSWLGSDGTFDEKLDPTGTHVFAFAHSKSPVLEPSNPNTLFNVHDGFGFWPHDLAAARSSSFNTWVTNNIIAPPSSSSTTTRTTTRATSTTLATSTTSAAAGSGIPTSCPGVSAPRYPGSVASGWRAVKIAGGLRTPRMVIVDPVGRLVVSEVGKGITQHTLSSNGCITSSKTIIAQTNLNHGVAITPDGKYLYASSSTTVWRWNYDSNAGTATGPTVVVKSMSNAGHVTRTLVIPKNHPNLLVVSVGSDGNLDMPTQNMAAQRAVVKVFDMNSPPSGGFDFTSGGWQAGYGLRNEVGLVFDSDNNLWGVENSADDLTRVANGQTTDIHVDNPAEELNFLGDVSVPNTKWYGYPICFTVWEPSVIPDKTFQVGEQFMIQPNSSFNDATCAQRSTPPRLSFQAHSAPLDASFDNSNSNLFVSFHGSWNRPVPTGFKLVAVKFQRGSNGQLGPVASPNSKNGYTDIWWNTDSSKCSGTNCFRPVGVTHDSVGRMFVTSDAPGEGELFLLGPANGAVTTSSVRPVSTTTSARPVSTTTTARVTTTVATTTRITTTATRTTTASGAQQTKYGQCGGQGWTGPTVCVSGSTCVLNNAWYSQCL